MEGRREGRKKERKERRKERERERKTYLEMVKLKLRATFNTGVMVSIMCQVAQGTLCTMFIILTEGLPLSIA